MIGSKEPAYKCIIKDIKNATYVHQGSPNPSYISLYGKKVSRVTLVGIVVQKGKHKLILDDGTGSILIRVFSGKDWSKQTNIGDVIQVIGKIRSHEGKILIGGEILSKRDSDKWIKLHKKQTKTLYTHNQPTKTRVKPTPEASNKTTKIIQEIQERDKGEGAPMQDIIDTLPGDTEKHIKTLIHEGEIYENKPGHLKTL